MKKNIILADCEVDEVESFANGFAKQSKSPIYIISSISNWGYGNLIMNIKRYIRYFTFPFKIFLKRNDYDIIIGWQQFYSIIVAFYCRLFHVKKKNTIVICNFTYRRKKGIIGTVYHIFMKYSVNSKYVDFVHVLSDGYANVCSRNMNIRRNKFVVTNFGVPDTFVKWNQSEVDAKNYTLSIGRSNRDFDFLIDIWQNAAFKDQELIIISDTYKPSRVLPSNITLKDSIVGDASFPWMRNCKAMIIPIDDGAVCSGDTVLLNGMMFEKTVIVTNPSTLAEMYIEDNVDGICVEKDIDAAVLRLGELLSDTDRLMKIGNEARSKYLNKFSRFAMAADICKKMI